MIIVLKKRKVVKSNNLKCTEKLYNKSINLGKKDLILISDIKVIGDITCGNIYGKNGKKFSITAMHIQAGNIDVSNLDASYVLAGNVTALDIDVANIKAKDIYARYINVTHEIDAHNVTGWKDIKAGRIKARKIKYGDICHTVVGIFCNSIKGRFKSSRHFALNGEIVVKK